MYICLYERIYVYTVRLSRCACVNMRVGVCVCRCVCFVCSIPLTVPLTVRYFQRQQQFSNLSEWPNKGKHTHQLLESLRIVPWIPSLMVYQQWRIDHPDVEEW